MAAALQAIRFDRWKAEDAVEARRRRAGRGAEFLRHDDAPLRVELLLEG